MYITIDSDDTDKQSKINRENQLLEGEHVSYR